MHQMRGGTAARAATGVPDVADRDIADREPGTRHESARVRDSLFRPFGRSPARVDGTFGRAILRSREGRDPADGAVLSGTSKRRRRRSAAPRMRPALAPAVTGRHACDPPDAGGRKLRPEPHPRSRSNDSKGPRLPKFSPESFPAAAPVLALEIVGGEKSMVWRQCPSRPPGKRRSGVAVIVGRAR